MHVRPTDNRAAHGQGGFSLVEAMLSAAVFSIVVTSFAGALIVGQQSTLGAGARARAMNLAEEGLESVRNIRDQAMNELQYAQSGVQVSGNVWGFLGEGSTETIDTFTRTISFGDVCRTGANVIAACPASYTDPHTKQVTVAVSWPVGPGLTTSSVTRVSYLTDWESASWTQTNWIGGSGQVAWSATDKYDSATGVNVGVAGQVTLAGMGGGLFVDDEQAEFNAGSHSQTQYDTGNTWLELTGAGQTAGTGTFTSRIFDAGGTAVWSAFDWVPVRPTGKELPNDGATESGYAAGNVAMTNNQFLYHLNQNSGATSFTDNSGNGRTATCAGGQCPTAGVAGNQGNAVTFDGTNDRLTSPVNLATYLGGTSSLSVWIKTTQTGNATFWEAPGITGVESNGNGNDIFWGWISNTGRIGFNVGDGGGLLSANPINNNQWHHVLMTRNATTGAIALYVDGVAQTGTSDTGAKTTAFTTIGMVDDTGGTPTFYAGSMDELAVWNRVLSPTEAADIYRRGALNLTFQVRSCDDAACAGESFMGPDGTGSTVYSEIANATLNPPATTVTNVANNRYMQYRAVLTTLNASLSPEVTKVSLPHIGLLIDDTQAEFNTGTYTATQYDTGNSWLELTAGGQSAGTGTYASEVFDIGGAAAWSTFGWLPQRPTGKELPGAGGMETGYTTGNMAMTGNVLLAHLNEASGTTFADSSGTGNNGTCTGVGCPTYGSAGKLAQAITANGTNDEIVVPDAASLDIADDLTVMGWFNATGAGTALGDIGNATIDSLEFDTADGQTPDILQVSGDVYVVAYTGPGQDGWLATFTIDSFGNVGNAVIDTLEFDTADGRSPSIVHVSGNIYAVAYDGVDNDGWVKTFSITPAGDISNATIDSLEFNTTNGLTPHLVHVSGTAYAVAYTGPDGDGWVTSFTISAAGDISNSTVDSLEFDTADGLRPYLFPVSGNIYAVAYTGPAGDGFLKSFTVSGTGDIGNSVIDTLEFDTADGQAPSVVHVSGNVFAVAYRGPGDDGWVKTVTISGTGDIGNATVSSFEFDASNGLAPQIAHVHGNVYAVAYTGPGNDGWSATFTISPAGTIGGATIDTFEWNTSDGVEASLIHVNRDIWAVAYQGPAGDGFVTTFDIASNRGVSKSGAYGLSSTTTTATGIINGVTVSSAITSGWHHLALTYDNDLGSNQIRLFVDGTQTATATLTADINLNDWDAVLGSQFAGALDEVAVFSRMLSATEVNDAWRRGALRANYQVRSCDDAACAGESFMGPDGTGSTVYSELMNTGLTPPSALPLTNVADNQYFQYRVVLETDAAAISPEIRSVTIQHGAGGGSGYQVAGSLLSSAYNMGDASPVEIIEWDQQAASCSPACSIRFQLRTAPDNAGSPGTWTGWYGATGPGTYFTAATGTRVPVALNGNQWVQYRVELAGDGTDTPTLDEVRVYYR